MLILYDKTNFENKIFIDRKKALEFELKLNKSEYSKKWKDIGDLLYEYSLGKNIQGIELTPFQYTYFSKR